MKKVKIRIAVAVAPDGEWNCCGWSTAPGELMTDNELFSHAEDPMPEGCRRYILTAEVDAPEEHDVTIVEAGVEKA